MSIGRCSFLRCYSALTVRRSSRFYSLYSFNTDRNSDKSNMLQFRIFFMIIACSSSYALLLLDTNFSCDSIGCNRTHGITNFSFWRWSTTGSRQVLGRPLDLHVLAVLRKDTHVHTQMIQNNYRLICISIRLHIRAPATKLISKLTGAHHRIQTRRIWVGLLSRYLARELEIIKKFR